MTPVITIVLSLVAGALLGGCGKGGIEKDLLERSAHLQDQVTTGQHVVTALGAALIITSCGLAAALYRNRKGGRRATQPTKSRRA